MRATWQFNYWFGIAACCGIAGICCLWSPAGAPLVRNGDVSASLRPLQVFRKNDPALAVPDWQAQPALEDRLPAVGMSRSARQLPAAEADRSTEFTRGLTGFPAATARRHETAADDTRATRQEEFARQVAVTDPLVGVVRLADLDPAGLDLEAEFAALRAPASSPAEAAQPAAHTPQVIAPEFAPLPEIRAQPRRQSPAATVPTQSPVTTQSPIPAQSPVRLTGIEPLPD